MFPNWICPGLMENKDESAAALIYAVILTHKHVDSQKEF